MSHSRLLYPVTADKPVWLLGTAAGQNQYESSTAFSQVLYGGVTGKWTMSSSPTAAYDQFQNDLRHSVAITDVNVPDVLNLSSTWKNPIAVARANQLNRIINADGKSPAAVINRVVGGSVEWRCVEPDLSQSDKYPFEEIVLGRPAPDCFTTIVVKDEAVLQYVPEVHFEFLYVSVHCGISVTPPKHLPCTVMYDASARQLVVRSDTFTKLLAALYFCLSIATGVKHDTSLITAEFASIHSLLEQEALAGQSFANVARASLGAVHQTFLRYVFDVLKQSSAATNALRRGGGSTNDQVKLKKLGGWTMKLSNPNTIDTPLYAQWYYRSKKDGSAVPAAWNAQGVLVRRLFEAARLGTGLQLVQTEMTVPETKSGYAIDLLVSDSDKLLLSDTPKYAKTFPRCFYRNGVRHKVDLAAYAMYPEFADHFQYIADTAGWAKIIGGITVKAWPASHILTANTIVETMTVNRTCPSLITGGGNTRNTDGPLDTGHWDAQTLYRRGANVVYHGRPYELVFSQGLKTQWSRGERPSRYPDVWKPRFGGARTVATERRRYPRKSQLESSYTPPKKSTKHKGRRLSIYDVHPKKGELDPYGYSHTKDMTDAQRHLALSRAVKGWPQRRLPAIGARHVMRHLRLITNKMSPTTHGDAIDRLRDDATWVTRRYHETKYWVVSKSH